MRWHGFEARKRGGGQLPKGFILMVLLAVLVWSAGPVAGVPMAPPQANAAPGNFPKSTASVEPGLWPHAASDLAPDPKLIFGNLANGIRYVLKENPEPPGRVSMHLHVLAGSMNERDNQRGVAHFLEHMQFNGSTHFPPGEMVKYFQRIGMQFGPDANARTGFLDTTYDILLPDSDGKSIGEGLQVLKDWAGGALLIPEEINRERRVILAEKRSRDSASYRTFKETLNFEFPGTILPRRLPIGIERVIRNTDQALVKDYYDTWYRPENMILVMVGDFISRDIEPQIREMFMDLSPKGAAPAAPAFGRIDHRGIKAFYHHEKEVGHTTVSIEVLDQISPHPDSVEYQLQQVVRDVANRIVQDRLDTLLRKPGTPFTSAAIGSGRFLQRVTYAEISSDCSPENWEDTLSVTEKTLRQAIEFGFSATELERVRKDFISQLDDAVKKAPTRKSQTIARQIMRHLSDNRVFRSPVQERDLFKPFLQTLTVEQVEAAFRSIWSPDHRLVLLTGNADLGQGPTAPEARINAAYKKSSTTAVNRPAEEDDVVFPYFSEPERAGKIQSRRAIEDIGVIQVDFQNGFRLNLKRTDFKAGEVKFNLVFGRGRSSQPRALPGLARLTEESMNESGLGALNRDQFDRALAGKQTRMRFRVEEDRFSYRGESVPEEVALMFQLLHAHLADPGFRDDAFSLCMERFQQKYNTLARTVEGAMALQGARFLAGGDNRFGLPPFERFHRLTLDQVRAWIEPALTRAPLELSVVGDFDIETVIDLAARYLASLPSRKAAGPVVLSEGPRFPESESLTIELTTRIPKGLVAVVYPTDDMWDISRTRRLSVLAEVFSDRLRERIREKLGAAYSPAAFNRPSRAYAGYGLFKIFIQVAPEEAALVQRQVKAISADLIQGGISHDELKRALDPTLTGIKDMMRQNRYWLNTVLVGSRHHPEQMDWCRTIQSDYAAITVDDLTPLAQKYLDNRKAAAITIQPVPGPSGAGGPGAKTGARPAARP
jgi:zinc protease